jgi:hypothetical protein
MVQTMGCRASAFAWWPWVCPLLLPLVLLLFLLTPLCGAGRALAGAPSLPQLQQVEAPGTAVSSGGTRAPEPAAAAAAGPPTTTCAGALDARDPTADSYTRLLGILATCRREFLGAVYVYGRELAAAGVRYLPRGGFNREWHEGRACTARTSTPRTCYSRATWAC